MSKIPILLVDDEEDIRVVLGITLADLGYEVFTAENGQEGLRIFEKIAPSIVITDIKMPDIDGINLLKKIKNINPNTEVIMITGHGDMDSAIESFQYEAADFVTKPINVDALEASLRKAEENLTTRRLLKEYTENLEAMIYGQTERLAEAEKQLEMEMSPDRVESIQRRMGYLFNDLPCFLTIQDGSHRFTAVNRVFKDHFGDQTGNLCYEVTRGQEEPCPDCPAAGTFETGESQQAEMELVTRRGNKINVMVMTSPVRNPDGVVTHVICLATDMNQIIQVQDRLSQLGLMIGSISHGIKGLLTGLDGGIYMLESGFNKKNETMMQQGLEAVKLTGGRIRGMVLDILMFAKDRELNVESTDLGGFLDDVVAESKVAVHGAKIVFELAPPPENLMIQADSGLLKTALVNILDNAVDACLEDSAKSEHRILFGAKKAEGDVLFEIIDNGVGMDEETTQKLFTLFYSSKGSRGTGLGLYISHQVIARHGGSIRFHSALGSGTRFEVRVPTGPKTQ